MSETEADTCRKHVLPKLYAAGPTARDQTKQAGFQGNTTIRAQPLLRPHKAEFERAWPFLMSRKKTEATYKKQVVERGRL